MVTSSAVVGSSAINKLRPIGQRHGDHHTLPLPARQLVGIILPVAFLRRGCPLCSKAPECARAPRRRSGPWCSWIDSASCFSIVCSGFKRRHRLLKDEADVIAAHVAQVGLRGADHLAPLIGDRPRNIGAVGQKRHRGKELSRICPIHFRRPKQRSRPSATVKAYAHAPQGGSCPSCRNADAQVVDGQKAHWKVFLGSNASRTPSKMKTSSDRRIEKVMKAVKASHGACRFCFA